MIKAKFSDKDGIPILVFGLSHDNLRRLKARQPITFNLGDLGFKPPINVMIFSGRTEEGMKAELGEFFTMPGEEMVSTDPPGGGDILTGEAHGRNDSLLDTRNGLLVDYSTVVAISEDPDDFKVGVLFEGRINQSTERGKQLIFVGEDGIAAIVSELVALLGRAAHPLRERLFERIEALRAEGLTDPGEVPT